LLKTDFRRRNDYSNGPDERFAVPDARFAILVGRFPLIGLSRIPSWSDSSAICRSKPARFRASCRSAPGDNARADSIAWSALQSKAVRSDLCLVKSPPDEFESLGCKLW